MTDWQLKRLTRAEVETYARLVVALAARDGDATVRERERARVCVCVRERETETER